MKVCNPLTHSLTQSYIQVQYAKKRSAYTYAYTYYIYYIIYGRKLYNMLIVPCAYLTRLSLNNTLKCGLKLHYFIFAKFWLVKTKAFGQYACTLCDHMFGS